MKAHHFVPALLVVSPPDERSTEGDHDCFSHPDAATASPVPSIHLQNNNKGTDSQVTEEHTTRRQMKNTLLISATAALFALVTSQTIAQEKSSKPAYVVAETNLVKATVEDVNQKKREVTLKDQEGNKLKMKVSDDVRNFDQVRKGDQVLAGYYQSAAISVNKPGEAPAEPGQEEAMIVSPKGEKPGGIAVKTTQVTATVEDIDYPKREVKLKGPEGNTVTIKVGDRVKRLDEVKKGDQVVARYTEALAVSMSKPEE
jgi:hypothetical protein